MRDGFYWKHPVVISLYQIGLLLVLSVGVSLCINMFRSDGISLVGDWSTEGRMTDEEGDSLIIPIMEAESAFHTQKVLFLDARDHTLFEQGHIKGAKNLPWHDVDNHFMAIIDGVPADQLIVTYCDGETCDLSHELAVFLQEMGFSNVKVLVNGWTVWKKMNLPVEGTSVEN